MIRAEVAVAGLLEPLGATLLAALLLGEAWAVRQSVEQRDRKGQRERHKW